MDEIKLSSMLQVIHEENKAIMSTLLRGVCYPEDYAHVQKDTLDNWDEIWAKVVNMGAENESEQSVEHDNSGTTDIDT